MFYDHSLPEFWNPENLRGEIDRIFDICNGCRMCFNYCPSFPALFEYAEKHDMEPKRMTQEEVDRVVDLCYDCKICYVKCPYTPPHRFNLDFPGLMLRARAVKRKKNGSNPVKEKFLNDSEFVGKLGSFLAPVSNWANDNRVNRFLMEKTLGIHRKKKLPEFQRETFIDWFQKEKISGRFSNGSNGKVALFYTCMINYNRPDIGKATVEVLEKNQIEVVCPEQKCCGMPQLGCGDIEGTVESLKFNVPELKKMIERGYDIVIPSPSCSMLIRNEYKDLFRSMEADVKQVASKTFDLCEYLVSLSREKKLNTDFQKSMRKIIYHAPCHLRAQNIGFKSKDLMELIPGTEVELVQQCSGHDGTWSMQVEFYDLSLQAGNKLFSKLENSDAPLTASDCSLSHLHIEQGAHRTAYHPIQILHMAYGLDTKESKTRQP